MANDKVKTAVEAEAEWWKEWREIDFSWEGLAEKEQSNSEEEQSIAWQGYWRRDPHSGIMRTDDDLIASGELIREPSKDDGEGKLWHIAHVPLEWADGTAEKKDWDEEKKAKLRAVIDSRLQIAKESEFDHTEADANAEDSLVEHLIRELANTEGHANFTGVVLCEPLRHPLGDDHTIYLTYAFSYLGEGFDRGARLCSGTLIYQSLLKTIPFENLKDKGVLFVYGSIILNNSRFSSGFHESPKLFTCRIFANYCHFYGRIDLNRSTFEYNISFKCSTFEKHLGFINATFKDGFDVSDSKFNESVHFGEATIFGDAIFSSAEFKKNIYFPKAAFKGSSTFVDAKFSDNIYCSGAIFEGDTNFLDVQFGGRATFQSCEFKKSADFGGVVFGKECNFSAVNSLGLLDMRRTAFSSVADFSNAHIMAGCNFDKANFAGRAGFDQTYFEWQDTSHCVTFKNSTFNGQADFRKALFPRKIEHISGAFWGARFIDVADFSETGVHWISAFNETLIEKKLLIDKTSERHADRQFRAHMLTGCKQAAQADCDNWLKDQLKLRTLGGKKPKPISGGEKGEHRRASYNKRLGELEGGCQTVKLVMGLTRDEMLEQRYYRYQLRARTHRTDIPWWEKAFAFMYGLVSDFGASVFRPLISLVVLVLLFATGFWSTGVYLGFVQPNDIGSYYQALSLSWTNVFKPLSALSNDAILPGTLADHLIKNHDNADVAFGITAASTVESVFAIILAFLVALSVRRRFQIS